MAVRIRIFPAIAVQIITLKTIASITVTMTAVSLLGGSRPFVDVELNTLEVFIIIPLSLEI
jgi:hypothetical protein